MKREKKKINIILLPLSRLKIMWLLYKIENSNRICVVDVSSMLEEKEQNDGKKEEK